MGVKIDKKQKVINNRTTAPERTVRAAQATGGLKCILLAPNPRHRFCRC